jgi:hypothetical protein
MDLIKGPAGYVALPKSVEYCKALQNHERITAENRCSRAIGPYIEPLSKHGRAKTLTAHKTPPPHRLERYTNTNKHRTNARQQHPAQCPATLLMPFRRDPRDLPHGE